MRKMILAAKNLLSYFLIVGSSDGWYFLRFCWKGFDSCLIGIMCCMNCVLKVFRSSYVHAKTSLNSLNNLINVVFSAGLQSIPRFIVWGFSYVPKFMLSYLIWELLVLQLGTDLNLSWRSKNFSNLSTELGTSFTFSKAFSTEQKSFITEKSRRFSSWVTSSMAESLKVSSFVRKFSTYTSLSNTR